MAGQEARYRSWWLSRSLAAAREKAADCRKLIRHGINPRDQENSSTSSVLSFTDCTQQFIKSKSAEWSNTKHATQWTATLSTYAFPHIGKMAVDKIGLDEVLAVLEPIWLDKNETGASGSATLDPDGSFTYTPDAGFAGDDSFSYQAHDNKGGVSAVAVVTIAVEQVGTPVDCTVYPDKATCNADAACRWSGGKVKSCLSR